MLKSRLGVGKWHFEFSSPVTQWSGEGETRGGQANLDVRPAIPEILAAAPSTLWRKWGLGSWSYCCIRVDLSRQSIQYDVVNFVQT